MTRAATSGGNKTYRFCVAVISRVSCAADVIRSWNDSQLSASAASANTPDLWNSWRNSSTVDLSLSFLMSKLGLPRDDRGFDLIPISSSATRSRCVVPAFSLGVASVKPQGYDRSQTCECPCCNPRSIDGDPVADTRYQPP